MDFLTILPLVRRSIEQSGIPTSGGKILYVSNLAARILIF